MSELQILGLIVLFLAALPVYALAELIHKKRLYSLFAGWKPEKYSDPDAAGELGCKTLKQFALVMALISIPCFFNWGNPFVLAALIVLMPCIPLVIGIIQTHKKYRL